MVDLVDSIGRNRERNYNTSQRSDPELPGAPYIAGNLQFVEGPSDCREPVRLLRAPQIARAPLIVGAPQIAGGWSDCWGSSDCWGLLILMGLLRLSGPFRLVRAPQISICSTGFPEN